MFLPTTADEMRRLGWDEVDVVLVSGDAYVDSPYSGIAVIGQVLLKAGFRVAVLSQPPTGDPAAFREFGPPRLFWGISAGCVDSMVANYTASGKRRRQDDFTPGGENVRRPDRATIVYANLARAAYRPARPIVLGGIEASLRRVAHYDFWSDKVRRPVICDAKADILCYGMGERAMTALAEAMRDGKDWHGIRGICYLASEAAVPARTLATAVRLPSFAEVSAPTDEGRRAFLAAFNMFSAEQDAVTARPLLQQVDTRFLVHNPPALPLEPGELDAVHPRAGGDTRAGHNPVRRDDASRLLWQLSVLRDCCPPGAARGEPLARLHCGRSGTICAPSALSRHGIGRGWADGQHVRNRLRTKEGEGGVSREGLPVPVRLPRTETGPLGTACAA